MSYNKKISLKIVNNSTVPLPIAILDGNTTPATNTNDKVLISWDISGELFEVGTITLNTTIPVTRDLVTSNIKGVVDALNTMGKGYFTYVGSIIYATYLTDNSVITASLKIGEFTYFIGTGYDDTVLDMVFYNAFNSTLIGGEFLDYNGSIANRFLRVQNDGSVDSTYGVGLNGDCQAVAIQSGNRFLVAGDFTTASGNARNRIARYLPTSFDNTFIVGTGFNNGVNALAVQSDDKIIVGGLFSTYDGNPCAGICRLNADGTFDGTFNVGLGVGLGVVNGVTIQSDGKIIIVGFFTTYDGNPSNNIARINTDGTYDATFNVGTGFDTAMIVSKVLSDGGIMVAGTCSTYKGSSRKLAVKLDSVGNVDLSFTGSFFDAGGEQVSDFVELPDGKIVFVGRLFQYDQLIPKPIANIVRTNADGTFDATFNMGSGFGGSRVEKILLQTDGKLLCGGTILSYDGVPYNNIVRLNSNGSSDTTTA